MDRSLNSWPVYFFYGIQGRRCIKNAYICQIVFLDFLSWKSEYSLRASTHGCGACLYLRQLWQWCAPSEHRCLWHCLCGEFCCCWGFFLPLAAAMRSWATNWWYRYMMPHRYPISKISEVAKSTGHTGTIGLSSRRVTVRFADRSVMKSSLPLQLSPRDRDGFIDALRAVNPSINVEGGIS